MGFLGSIFGNKSQIESLKREIEQCQRNIKKAQQDIKNGYNKERLKKRKHSKKCTFYTLRFGCSFAAVNTIKPQLL